MAGSAERSDLIRPNLFWFNICLTLLIIVCLIFLPVPSYFTFMLGCVSITLLVNYPGAKLQNKIIKSHSGPALMMASTILVAGVFLGVLESEIMNHMANILASFIPQSMGRFLPLIIGVLSVPLTMMFCTDSYFYGLPPGSHRCRKQIWSEPCTYRNSHGGMPQLCNLYKPCGTGYLFRRGPSQALRLKTILKPAFLDLGRQPCLHGRRSCSRSNFALKIISILYPTPYTSKGELPQRMHGGPPLKLMKTSYSISEVRRTPCLINRFEASRHHIDDKTVGFYITWE